MAVRLSWRMCTYSGPTCTFCALSHLHTTVVALVVAVVVAVAVAIAVFLGCLAGCRGGWSLGNKVQCTWRLTRDTRYLAHGLLGYTGAGRGSPGTLCHSPLRICGPFAPVWVFFHSQHGFFAAWYTMGVALVRILHRAALALQHL